MVSELPWAKKRTFWAFEKVIFQVFANFRVTKLKPFFGKVRQRVQSYLNQNVVIGSFLENGFWATLSWKTNVLKVWKGHFSFFCKFLRAKQKQFSEKVRQSLQKYLNQNLVIRNFLETGFQAILSWKTNVVNVWKGEFSFFFKFLSGEVENVFCENKTKCSEVSE